MKRVRFEGRDYLFPSMPPTGKKYSLPLVMGIGDIVFDVKERCRVVDNGTDDVPDSLRSAGVFLEDV
jgi:hypothetical protein